MSTTNTEQLHELISNSQVVFLICPSYLKTASWGKSAKAKAYRDKHASLIKAGKFREAVKMYIKDLKLKFGNKYIRLLVKYGNMLIN